VALALGATVGVVESRGREASRALLEAEGWSVPQLLWLPRDPMTIRAFVRASAPQSEATPGEASITEACAMPLAQAIHAAFLAENPDPVSDPARLPFDQLREDLKLSNMDQARYAVTVLGRAGHGVRRQEGEPAPVALGDAEVETMAEMEHGRWVVERLLQGWRYGTPRDAERRISPHLVAWQDLPDAIKQRDRNTVRAWPDIFARAGLEVFRIAQG
jgi:hypothetical protein